MLVGPEFREGLKGGQYPFRCSGPIATRELARPLIRFVRALEVEVGDQAARVSARAKMVVKWMMRSAGHRYRFHVSADTPVDEKGGAVDFAAVKAEESMAGAAILFTVEISHHQTRFRMTTALMISL